MKEMRVKTCVKTAATAISAIGIVGCVMGPAIASPASTGVSRHCSVVNELCTVTLPSFPGGFVAFSTSFPGQGSAKRGYSILKGTSGDELCGGTMSYNTTSSCTTSYVGKISFQFANETATGNISISG